jgi:hypothetical protein
MSKLSKEQLAVNLALGPLINAITRRWKERDARALCQLREISAGQKEPSKDVALRPMQRHPASRLAYSHKGRFDEFRAEIVPPTI